MCMNMSRNKQNKVRLAKFISKNLLLRNSADELFNYINEINSNEIIVDFNKIQSVTRSFSHQYLLNKNKSEKNIININISPQVKTMFEIVEKANKNLCLS